MKRKLKVSLLCLTLVSSLAFSGCNGNQQTVAIKTIGSLEVTVDNAYKSYVSLVVTGQLPTNDVPTAANVFNKFQASAVLATVAVKNNTNALAPDSLIEESAAAVALFNQFKSLKGK